MCQLVCIVIGDFKRMLPDKLSLRVGERIEIISKDTIPHLTHNFHVVRCD